MAISEQWAELLSPGLKAIFEVQRDALAAASRIPELFSVQSSAKAQEQYLGVGGMSDWNEYKGAIEYDDFDQLYKTTFTHTEYVRGFKVERKLVDDDLYNVISPRPKQLALSAVRKQEKDAASMFNNAFVTSDPNTSVATVGGDAVSLCSDSHPLAPTHAGDTFDNKGATALSYDAVVATRKLMRTYTDDRGELVQVMPDTLLVPPELEDVAWTIFNSENKPGGADNDGNFNRSQSLKVIVWDYLTDANNWFMIDSKMLSLHSLWLNRVGLEFAMDPNSDFRLEARFRGYMRYSFGWSDWRWIYGHLVA